MAVRQKARFDLERPLLNHVLCDPVNLCFGLQVSVGKRLEIKLPVAL